MTQKEFEALEVGDIVIHQTGLTYLVTGRSDDHVTVVRTIDMRHPEEWRILSKAQHISQCD